VPIKNRPLRPCKIRKSPSLQHLEQLALPTPSYWPYLPAHALSSPSALILKSDYGGPCRTWLAQRTSRTLVFVHGPRRNRSNRMFLDVFSPFWDCACRQIGLTVGLAAPLGRQLRSCFVVCSKWACAPPQTQSVLLPYPPFYLSFLAWLLR